MSVRKGELLKLTEDDIRLIGLLKWERRKLEMQRSQLTDKRLAEKFDVTYSTIEKVPMYRPETE